MCKTYGYIRVSTFAQREDRQQLALGEYGIPQERIFVDRQSGKDFARPACRRQVKALRKGGHPRRSIVAVVSVPR